MEYIKYFHFRVPKNEQLLTLWVQSIGSYADTPLRGMVCVNHFNGDSIKQATKTKTISLKIGAVPTIFQSFESTLSNDIARPMESNAISSNSNSQTIGRMESTGADLVCSNECCKILRFEYDQLLKKHADSSINYELKVKKLETQIEKLQLKNSDKLMHIKNLDDKLNYAKKSKEVLKNTIKDLKEKNLLSSEAIESIEKIAQDEVLLCLINGVKPGEKYSKEVRKFCFTVHYHSPAAYEIIRKKFDNHLPHTKTVKAWYQLSDISGEPGMHEETVKRLKSIVNDMEEPLICALVFDEMYIRKQVHYDPHKMNYVGYASYPVPQTQLIDPENPECAGYEIPKSPIATQAIVFMLCGINKHFQFPFAYHFIDQKLDAIDRVELVKEVILKVSECGVKISNLTFDGLQANFAMCRQFGANLDVSSPEFQPFFENPYNNDRIYIVLDPCHMEKLIRNTLGKKEVFYDENDAEIKWSHFVELEKLSREKGLFTHKLSKKHIEWKRNIMNVRIATETFSESVANSMEILKQQGHTLFVDAGPSIQFSLNIDKLFNIFNSKVTRNSNIFKCALNKHNKQEIFQFLDECSTYLKSLKLNKTVTRKGRQNIVKAFIVDTQNHTGFRGFIINIMVFKLMYMEYIEEKSLLENISAYAFSQDHVEIFFSKIRARNGHNDNPNVLQFKGAFRRLLCNLELKVPEKSNCQMFESGLQGQSDWSTHSNIYFTSSRRPKLDILNDIQFQRNFTSQYEELLEKRVELEGIQNEEHLIDGLGGASIAYAAKTIEEKIESKKFYCDECKYVFCENERLADCTFFLIPSKRPCVSTYNICKIVDRYLTIHHKDKPNSMNSEKYDFNVLYYMIFQDINFEKMYEKTDFSNHIEHRYHLIKCIIREYISIKTTQISKEITLGAYETLLRKRLTKWIHFCGQVRIRDKKTIFKKFISLISEMK